MQACNTSSAFDDQRRFRLERPTPARAATSRMLNSSQPISTSKVACHREHTLVDRRVPRPAGGAVVSGHVGSARAEHPAQ